MCSTKVNVVIFTNILYLKPSKINVVPFETNLIECFERSEIYSQKIHTQTFGVFFTLNL